MSLEFEEKGSPKASYTNDLHPLHMFLNGDLDTRAEIILNHPDVIGFVYLHDDNITEYFLPKKVVNFAASFPEKRKTIVAVSGDTDDYNFISVPESVLLSDTLHLLDFSTLNKKTHVESIASFSKESKDELPDLPDEFNTEAKLENEGSFLYNYSTYHQRYRISRR